MAIPGQTNMLLIALLRVALQEVNKQFVLLRIRVLIVPEIALLQEATTQEQSYALRENGQLVAIPDQTNMLLIAGLRVALQEVNKQFVLLRIHVLIVQEIALLQEATTQAQLCALRGNGLLIITMFMSEILMTAIGFKMRKSLSMADL